MTEQQSDNQMDFSSLGSDDSGDFLFQEVALATRLREGSEGVRAFIQAVISKRPSSLKDLAMQLGWPVPVAAAVRRELEKAGILSRDRGLGLSREAEARFRSWNRTPEAVAVCPGCGGTGLRSSRAYDETLFPLIRSLVLRRPRADVTLDQALATAETNLKRSILLASMLPPEPGRVVFLGDDDWTSASLTLALRHLYGSEHPIRIEVLDIDPRIVEGLSEFAAAESLPLTIRIQDLRNWDERPDDVAPADLVFTDPPYTEPGLDLFCGWARWFLKDDMGRLVLCYPRRDPATHFRIQAIWQHWGFSLLDQWAGWNEYEGNSLHAGRSALWRLQAVAPIVGEPSVFQVRESIYTFDQKDRTAREYECLGCGKKLFVGPGRQFVTIEGLKEAGCPKCGHDTFKAY